MIHSGKAAALARARAARTAPPPDPYADAAEVAREAAGTDGQTWAIHDWTGAEFAPVDSDRETVRWTDPDGREHVHAIIGPPDTGLVPLAHGQGHRSADGRGVRVKPDHGTQIRVMASGLWPNSARSGPVRWSGPAVLNWTLTPRELPALDPARLTLLLTVVPAAVLLDVTQRQRCRVTAGRSRGGMGRSGRVTVDRAAAAAAATVAIDTGEAAAAEAASRAVWRAAGPRSSLTPKQLRATRERSREAAAAAVQQRREAAARADLEAGLPIG